MTRLIYEYVSNIHLIFHDSVANGCSPIIWINVIVFYYMLIV